MCDRGFYITSIFENEVVSVDCEKKCVDFRYSLNSLIFSIIYVEKLNMIVIIHEMGLVVINDKGQKVWSGGGTDIIQDYKLIDNCIYIKCIDGYEITYSVMDGKAIC